MGLLTLIWIFVAAAAAFVAFQLKAWLPAIVAGAVAALGAAWILGCAFSSAVPDRRCPSCGKEALIRPRRDRSAGVRCTACGFADAEMYRAYLDEV